jgi:hypothetical protein
MDACAIMQAGVGTLGVLEFHPGCERDTIDASATLGIESGSSKIWRVDP